MHGNFRNRFRRVLEIEGIGIAYGEFYDASDQSRKGSFEKACQASQIRPSQRGKRHLPSNGLGGADGAPS